MTALGQTQEEDSSPLLCSENECVQVEARCGSPRTFRGWCGCPSSCPCSFPFQRVVLLHQVGWRASGQAELLCRRARLLQILTALGAGHGQPLAEPQPELAPWCFSFRASPQRGVSGGLSRSCRARTCVCAHVRACVCVCVCMRVRVCVTPRPESRLRAVTATPVAGSGPHQAGSLMLVPWPKPSSVNVGDETLAPKRRETRVLWTRDFNREDSEQYLASSLASSSSSTSLMSERCRHGHLGPGTGDGSSARGPTWVLSDRRAPVSPRKKGVMNGGQRGQLGPSSTPRPGCWGMRVPVKIQK